ncbi:MAG: multidrug effflux MFS transporter [Rhizobiaceae bacterium]|nr:multidrug effflux MFS transporter [Rhizobiaceae bacterium]MCV0408845.1 multidrug effflux MFS transporter [Rhizobiaceae bacterium]
MDQPVQRGVGNVPTLPIPRWEFIALAAALMALNALAIDVMLPAMQQIGESLGVADENSRQLVITAYIVGFGGGQLFFGPVSDRLGRRGPLLLGLAVYVLAALGAAFAPSFTMLLVLRFIQGLGAASTRVIAVSVVRDTHGGRAMAEVMSLVFMVFMVIPVIAPSIGQVIILFAEWHAIFLVIAGLALAFTIWTAMRLPETLRPENRRDFTVSAIAEGFRMVVTNRSSFCYTVATTAVFGGLFGFINSAQQIFIGIYDTGTSFPLLFALVAGMMAISSFLNARFVGRFGMRALSQAALLGFLTVSTLTFVLSLFGPIPLPLFLTLFALAMFQFPWIGSNFNAMAMEHLGHVAGMASSIQGFVTTLGGGVIGALIGQAFNGTVVPLAAGYCFAGLFALCLVLVAERGRLFAPINPPVSH